MDRRIKAVCIFGTRPDAIKMAPVVEALRGAPDRFDTRVVVTGQHREQLDQVLKVFGIVPDRDLAIMQHGQTLTQITTRVLGALDEVLDAEKPDVVLAQGDTTTTFVAALAAFYHKVPYAHVEAGLRTGNLYDPFPEELNRRMAGVIASFHFAPTEASRENLLRENTPPERVWVTGNTGIDALLSVASRQVQVCDPQLAAILASGRRIVLITAHRRENWGEPLERICRAVARLAEAHTDCEFVYAMHRNPAVRATARPILEGLDRVHLIEPPDYGPFVKLMQRSALILTDSGGVQEEAPSLGVPVLVLRNTTERPEGVTAGVVKLIGTETEAIVREAEAVLAGGSQGRASIASPYGDGQASLRIRDILAAELPDA